MQIILSSTLDIADKNNLIVIIGIPKENKDGSFSLTTSAEEILLTNDQTKVANALYEKGTGASVEFIPQHLHAEATDMFEKGLLEVFSQSISTVFRKTYIPKLLMPWNDSTLLLSPNNKLIQIKKPITGTTLQLPSLIVDVVSNFSAKADVDMVINKTAKNIVEEKLGIPANDPDYGPAIEDFTFQTRTVLLIAVQGGIVGLDETKPSPGNLWNKFFRKN
jgi:hypothetical protein